MKRQSYCIETQTKEEIGKVNLKEQSLGSMVEAIERNP